MRKKKMPNAFEKSMFDKDGMKAKEGSPKEMKMDMLQIKRVPPKKKGKK